jgi:hypothetical protein
MVKLNTVAPATPSPVKQHARVGKPPAPHDASAKARLQMPNERDESVAMTADTPDPVIEQASVDVARGLQDTSKALELDRAYKKFR